jgi:hypothetical protein
MAKPPTDLLASALANVGRCKAHRDRGISLDIPAPLTIGQAAEIAAEIERVAARVKWLEDFNAATEGALTREKTKRLQAEHERDAAVEQLAQIRAEYAACIKTVDQLENSAGDVACAECGGRGRVTVIRIGNEVNIPCPACTEQGTRGPAHG